MEASARVSSRGQVTIPRAVREALAIEEGDDLIFKVDGQRAIIVRSEGLLELGGSVSVPASRRGTQWDQVLRETRRVRAAARR